MTNTAIIIPARYGSTRFPGKPLRLLAGKSMLQRVWETATLVKNVDQVVVATDDARIQEHVLQFGGQSVLTNKDIPNGTARVWAAAQVLETKPDYLLNLQGDAPLTPHWVVQAMVDELHKNEAPVVTPAVRMTPEIYEKLKEAKAGGEVSGTTVVCDKTGKAMYFSKSLIPFIRKLPEGIAFPVLRHIGLYAYTYDALKQYFELGETDLEEIEALEQLRYLYHGIPVQVVEVDYKGRTHWGVDSPEDAARVEAFLREHGEI